MSQSNEAAMQAVCEELAAKPDGVLEALAERHLPPTDTDGEKSGLVEDT